MVVVKVKEGYRVLSAKAKKNMGTYPTKAEAEGRQK